MKSQLTVVFAASKINKTTNENLNQEEPTYSFKSHSFLSIFLQDLCLRFKDSQSLVFTLFIFIIWKIIWGNTSISQTYYLNKNIFLFLLN